MTLDRPVHAAETADGTAAPAVAAPLASGFAAYSGLAQMCPRFSSPAIAMSPHFFSTALYTAAPPHARTAPQTPLESRQDACQWTPLDRLEESTSSSSRRPRASQCLHAFSSTQAGERCNVDSQVDQVVCDCRTAGSTARSMVARSPLLGAGAVPHPVLPTLPAISTERPPLPLQVRHAPSPVERNGRRPGSLHQHKQKP